MARPLGSTLSADRGAPPSLFERFSATISLSDFPPPCIAVVLLSDSQRGPWGHPPGVRGGISRLPCKQLPYVHRVSGPRGGGIVLAISERFHVAFRSYDYVGPPKSFSFRGSIPGPHVPLSMLRLHSYECTRMTRGQHGSLLLSCERLSLSATHRFAPAHVAVGTILSDRPPHRSQRAELPHWALTSGNNAQSLFGIVAPYPGRLPAVSVPAHFASPRFRRRCGLLAVSAISRLVPV